MKKVIVLTLTLALLVGFGTVTEAVTLKVGLDADPVSLDRESGGEIGGDAGFPDAALAAGDRDDVPDSRRELSFARVLHVHRVSLRIGVGVTVRVSAIASATSWRTSSRGSGR